MNAKRVNVQMFYYLFYTWIYISKVAFLTTVSNLM